MFKRWLLCTLLFSSSLAYGFDIPKLTPDSVGGWTLEIPYVEYELPPPIGTLAYAATLRSNDGCDYYIDFDTVQEVIPEVFPSNPPLLVTLSDRSGWEFRLPKVEINSFFPILDSSMRLFSSDGIVITVVTENGECESTSSSDPEPTPEPDPEPTPVSLHPIPSVFAPLKDVTPNTEHTSNTIIISNVLANTELRVDGGSASIIKNGVNTRSTRTTVNNGDEIAIRTSVTSSPISLTVEYGGQQKDWSINPATIQNPVTSSGQMSGYTAGQFQVNESGAATYSIPITTPAGTAGIQPQLALSYSSQGSNGLVGLGWSLGGLSVITRCSATRAQDNGLIDPVDFDDNDRFCLDGERLMAVTGSYGQEGTVYYTEQNSFKKVISHGQVGSAPERFTVYTKSGLIMEYGNTLDSRIEASGKQDVLFWAVNKIQDTVGNYLEVLYQENNTQGEYYPTEIRYTGNSSTGLNPYNSVTFEYEAREDVVPKYIGGSVLNNTKRLKTIKAWEGTTIFRTYHLAYQTSAMTKRSQLVSMQECGTDNSCFVPTAFTWTGSGEEAFTTQEMWVDGYGQDKHGWLNQSEYPRMLGDVNGDGLNDIIGFSGAGVSVSISTGSNFTKPEIWVNAYNSGNNSGQWSSQDKAPRMLGDVNGDGLTDIIGFSGAGVLVSLSTGDSFKEPEIWVKAYHWNRNFITPRMLGDVNGDGLTDIIGFAGSGVYVSLSTGHSFTEPKIWVRAYGDDLGWSNQDKAPRTVGDVNGDGLTDIIGFGGAGVLVSLSTGDSFKEPEVWVKAYHWNSDFITPRMLADVNGDGLNDVVGFSGRGVFVSLSTGTYFTQPEMWITGYGEDVGSWRNQDRVPRMLADINGDGLADIVGFAGAGVLVSSSTGVRFSEPKNWISFYGPDHAWNSDTLSPRRLADVNGDGSIDIVGFAGQGVFVSTSKPKTPELIQTIVNGHNQKTTIEYKPLTDSSVYLKENNAEYPMMDMQMPVYVVSSYDTDNGIGSTNRTSYFYQGAKMDLQGRGFRGFSQTTVTDETSGIATVTYYNRDYRYISTKVSRTEQFISQAGHPKDGCPISDADYQAELKQYGNGVHFSYFKQKTERQYEVNQCNQTPITTTITTNQYDDYGNPTQIRVDSGNGYVETTTNTYTDDVSKWHLGRLTQAIVTKQSPAQPNGVTRTSQFEYNPQTGLLTKETIEPNHALCLQKVYQHDKFGNIQTSTTQGCASTSPAIESRTHTTQYDDKGRFVTTSQNALGHAETKAYQQGNLTRLTGPNQLTTTWEYDGFGRKLLETRADNTQTRINYLLCDSSCPTLAKYFVRTETAGSIPKIIYYDILDREIRKQTIGFNGRKIFVDTQYNARGEVTRVSDPYFEGDTPYWTANEYDVIGRLIKQTSPAGHVSKTQHNGLTTIATNPLGQTETRTVNVLGQLIESKDNLSGSIKYAYDGFSNLIELIDPHGNSTRMEYDQRGNKIRMYDSDTGTTHYSYNALGELISQTDNKGQTVTNTYDKLGRMVKRQEPEGISTWQYDTVEKGVGKLAVMTGADGYQEQYRYDGFGRLYETKTVIDGASYFNSQTYDQYGRANSVTYPTGFAVNNVFNNNGYLQKVQRVNASTVYWEAKQRNAKGQLEQATLGNGLTTNKTYDVLTGRVQSIQTGAVQNLGFQFDAIGNLTQRSSGGLAENFTYDGLNRLTNASVQGGQSLTMRYDALGNITYKSDVGNYNYASGNAGIHAVSSAGNLSYSYDLNGNRISSSNGQSIVYTSFNKPSQISQGNSQLSFAYNPDYKRYKQTVVRNGVTTSKVYVSGGLYEREAKNAVVKDTHYIFAGGESVAVYIADSQNQTKTHYLHKDHLGSVETMTDESGQIVEQMSFDAWGQRRNTNWGKLSEQEIQALLDEPFSIERGFTGHEHLDEVNLIHMNGRVYDPVIGRFLSADPFVQSPTNTQSLNRYSYVQNNPLSMVDPSGFFLKKLWKGIKKAVKKYWKPVVAIAAGVVLGALTGGLGTGVVGAILSGAGFGFGSAFTGTLLNGGSVGDALKSGLKGAVIGGVSAGLTFGVMKIAQGVAKGINDWRYGNMELYDVIPDGQGGFSFEPTTTVRDRIFVNGMVNDTSKAAMNGFKQFNGQTFTLAHNPSHGFIADLTESALGKFIAPSNVSKQVADLIQTHGGTISHLTGHSQGGIIISNTLDVLASRGVKLPNLTVTFNGAAIHELTAKTAVNGVGANMGGFNASFFDLVPNVVGMNGISKNPLSILRIPASIIAAPTLTLGSKSPHSYP